ncbi:hypothetical protein ACNOYE_19140 [Nannocystaceae bacterium ST9]
MQPQIQTTPPPSQADRSPERTHASHAPPLHARRRRALWALGLVHADALAPADQRASHDTH